MKYLYHGTTRENVIKILEAGFIGAEYYHNYTNDLCVFLTDSFQKARMHGNYIFEISLRYDEHIKALKICKANKNKDWRILEKYDFNEFLDEGVSEYFYPNAILLENILAIYSPKKNEIIKNFPIVLFYKTDDYLQITYKER